jgi:hypothetical protein
MAIKVFEQVYPGQNALDLKPKKGISPQEWERKQRLKEYRIAARREKRNRKSDEKKQRKLNATILRRMVCTYLQSLREIRTDVYCGVDKKSGEIHQECWAKQVTGD